MKTRKVINAVACVLAGVLALLGWQLCSVLKSVDAAREKAANDWAASSSARAEFLRLYKAECGHPIRHEGNPSNEIRRPISGQECADAVAKNHAKDAGLPVEEAASLSGAMEAAANGIQLPIPLRWL